MNIDDLISFCIVNIDKPAGPTSHQVAEYVRKILHIKKSGHSGTLDPNVTGCLPVAMGNATRVLELMLKYGKEYICVMELHKPVAENKLREVMQQFLGDIEQLPPLKSSVKREIRTRTIYELEILQIRERRVLFRVSCQAGTYIRKLCDDIGKKLGTGAHMAELRRIRAGVFDESSLVTLNDLRDAYELLQEGRREKNAAAEEHGEQVLRKYLQPIETAVQKLAKVSVNEMGGLRVEHGQNLRGNNLINYEMEKKGETIAIFDENKDLIALGIYMVNPAQIKEHQQRFAVKVSKVFLRPGHKE